MKRKPKNLNEALQQFEASRADAREDRINARKNKMSLKEYERSPIDKKNDRIGAKKLLNKGSK